MSTEEKVIKNKVGLLKLSELLQHLRGLQGDGLLAGQFLSFQRVV